MLRDPWLVQPDIKPAAHNEPPLAFATKAEVEEAANRLKPALSEALIQDIIAGTAEQPPA